MASGIGTDGILLQQHGIGLSNEDSNEDPIEDPNEDLNEGPNDLPGSRYFPKPPHLAPPHHNTPP